MADIYIPSVSSGGPVDSNKQIERIMEIERVPLARMEEEQTQLRSERELWSSVKRSLASLLESSQSMFRFNNPFSARSVTSSNEKVAVGRSSTNSLLGTYELNVQQKASADRFASNPINSDYTVPAGNYAFSVGQSTIEISFDGGSIGQFAQALTSNGKGTLSASLVQVNDAQSVLLIASRETGSQNTLQFHADAKKLALETGILGSDKAKQLSVSEAFVAGIEAPQLQLDPGEEITLFAKKEAHDIRITASTPVKGTVLTASGTQEVHESDTIAISRGSIDIAKITVENTTDTVSELHLEAFTKAQANPMNSISRAQNAVITIEGIQIERPSNEFTEVLPGVSLDVRAVSDTPVELSVSPDTQFAKQEIIRLVGNYNITMQQINILTRDDPSIIDDISFSSEEERANALEDLGSLRGDTILTRLRSRLVNAVNSPIRVDRSISFLSEIGISTNQTSPGSFNASALRGYLEIHEATLDAALSDSFDFVSNIFGTDANGDQIIDSGFAFALSESVQQYTQNGGIIDTRTTRLSNQITASDTQIERYSDRLEDKEAELRRQFATMEQQVQSLQDNTRALDGFLNRQ